MFAKHKKFIRKIGFVSDQKGIIKRYINEEGNWAQHLKRSKEFIIRSAKNKNKGTVYVLGSGWLLDVPIDYLADTFNKVYLVDIVHPTQIKHRFKNMNNIIFLEADITGGTAEDIYQIINNNHSIAELTMQAFKYCEQPDFVISINLLNQLDIILADYLLKKGKFSETEIMEFRKAVQTNHIKSLPLGLSCLITDMEELRLDNAGKVNEKTPLIHISLPKSEHKEEWKWNFDMSRTYNLNFNTIFNVVAIDV